MDQRSLRILLGTAAGASVFGVGVLGGVVLEQTVYEPRRAAAVREVEATIRAYEARQAVRLPEAPRLNRPPRSSP
jgi:hypothetical protein